MYVDNPMDSVGPGTGYHISTSELPGQLMNWNDVKKMKGQMRSYQLMRLDRTLH